MSEIPQGWADVPIAEMVAHDGIFTDGDWVESKDQDPTGSVRLIQLADIGDGSFVDKSSRFLTVDKAYELRCTFLNKGDLLVARMPEPLGRCCLFPFDSEEAFVTVVDVCAIRLGSAEIDAKYLMHAINSAEIRNKISALQSGSTRKRISRKNLAGISIPLAPLNEQRRIVEKIENLFAELDKGEESLEAAKARAGLYRQSLLKHAFEGHLTADWRAANPDKLEDPETLLTRIQNERDARYKQALDDWQVELEKWRDDGEEGKKPAKPKRPAEISVDDFDPELLPELPAEWVLQHLGNLNVGVFDGPFGSNLKTSDYTDSGVQVIRLENIGYGNFITSKESFVSPEKYETIKKHTVFPRDIVFSSFVTDGIRSALVPSSVPFAVNKADCFAVQFFGATVSNEYVAHFLQSRWAYKAVEGLIHGVGRPRINTTQLKEIQVPICSPVEQDEIVKQLEAKLSIIEASEKQMDEQLARSKALRQSILKRAFAGELVDQDPNDEPASELLERIKAEKAEAEIAAKRDRKTKPVRKPKNRRPTMTDLIEVLKKEGDWVSASKAAQGLGIADGTSSDDVEAFYRELKKRIEAKEIEVERRGDEDWLRLAKVEAN